MNKIDFEIKTDWIGAVDADGDAEESTYANISINAGGHCATEVLEAESATHQKSIRVSAFDLAVWLAANWWRLRWEPEPEKASAEWMMRHHVASAGNGYMWPDLYFASHGESIKVCSKNTMDCKPQLIYYTQNFTTQVSAADFEKGIDSFLEGVVTRVSAMNTDETRELVELWNEVCTERKDSSSTAWRKMEAILGYDPDDAPDDMINAYLALNRECGELAVREMLMFSSSDKARQMLRQLRAHADERAKPITVPKLDRIRMAAREEQVDYRASYAMPPWKRGAKVAEIVRSAWGLDDGPVSTDTLLDRIQRSGADWDSIKDNPDADVFAGIRNGAENGLSVFIRKPHYPSAQRFNLARIIGDHIDTTMPSETLLPCADNRTLRQSFQRAFAREFLCPFRDLQNQLNLDDGELLGESDITRAAERFNVSDTVVRWMLVDNDVAEWDEVFAR